MQAIYKMHRQPEITLQVMLFINGHVLIFQNEKVNLAFFTQMGSLKFIVHYCS